MSQLRAALHKVGLHELGQQFLDSLEPQLITDEDMHSFQDMSNSEPCLPPYAPMPEAFHMCAINVIKNVRFPGETPINPETEPNTEWQFTDMFIGGNERRIIWNLGTKYHSKPLVRESVDEDGNCTVIEELEHFLDLRVRFHQMQFPAATYNFACSFFLLNRQFEHVSIKKNVAFGGVSNDQDVLGFSFPQDILTSKFRHDNHESSIILVTRLLCEKKLMTLDPSYRGLPMDLPGPTAVKQESQEPMEESMGAKQQHQQQQQQ